MDLYCGHVEEEEEEEEEEAKKTQKILAYAQEGS